MRLSLVLEVRAVPGSTVIEWGYERGGEFVPRDVVKSAMKRKKITQRR